MKMMIKIMSPPTQVAAFARDCVKTPETLKPNTVSAESDKRPQVERAVPGASLVAFELQSSYVLRSL